MSKVLEGKRNRIKPVPLSLMGAVSHSCDRQSSLSALPALAPLPLTGPHGQGHLCPGLWMGKGAQSGEAAAQIHTVLRVQ